MMTSIEEKLPWIDYQEVFDKLEARSRSLSSITSELKGYGISDDIIKAASEQTINKCSLQPRKRTDKTR